jgi:predicted NAD-dependent protein-ADP-ribosyltransferase YbiA (DUF1768 family)
LVQFTDQKMKDVINFYREGDDYGCFSNFSKHAINLEDSKKFSKIKQQKFGQLVSTVNLFSVLK